MFLKAMNTSDPVAAANPSADPGSSTDNPAVPAAEPPAAKPLTPAAQRALQEAAARRAEIDRKAAERPAEYNGRGGLEPARYGDWEIKGIACDF